MESGSPSPRSTTIGFLLAVHTLPPDLQEPLTEAQSYLHETSALYRFVLESRLLWRVWQVDVFGRFWIEVNRLGPRNHPEFHTLCLDEGTFDRIECDPYEVEVEAVPPID